jgi:hypothetical protein
VNKNLSAMVEASGSAVKAILERDTKIDKYEQALRLTALIIKAQRREISRIDAKLQIAEALLMRYGLLEEYIYANAQKSVLEALALTITQPQQPQTQPQ